VSAVFGHFDCPAPTAGSPRLPPERAPSHPSVCTRTSNGARRSAPPPAYPAHTHSLSGKAGPGLPLARPRFRPPDPLATGGSRPPIPRSRRALVCGGGSERGGAPCSPRRRARDSPPHGNYTFRCVRVARIVLLSGPGGPIHDLPNSFATPLLKQSNTDARRPARPTYVRAGDLSGHVDISTLTGTLQADNRN